MAPNEIPLRRRPLHRVQRVRPACKNENEVPWGINRRRVVTLNDGNSKDL